MYLDVRNFDTVRPPDQENVVVLPAEAAVVEIRPRRTLRALNVRDALVQLGVINFDAVVIGPRDQLAAPLNRRDWPLAAVQNSLLAAKPT